MKAEIYYGDLPPHPSETHWHELVTEILLGDTSVAMPIGFFRTYYRKLPIVEEIEDRSRGREKLFSKYNQSATNPYSSDNDPGQTMLHQAGARHTSMLVGDVIRIHKIYYMVGATGFRRVRFI